MKYRSEIDGLRAFAVVPVIFFHAGATIFSGGYAGVDVFFVISGYLIAGILIDDLEAGHFSIWNFYERRIRRIAPALTIMMLACIPFAWMWMMPDQFKYFGMAAGAAALSISNFVFWQRAGYFDAAAEIKPLLHTWSLAVEEQFYVFFPILLFFLWRYGWRRFSLVLIMISAFSLMLAEISARNWPDAGFYLAHTRAWELAAGVLCAIAERKVRIVPNQAVALLGLIMVITSMLAFDEHTMWPSLWTLLPVCGTALIILYARQGMIAANLLSWRPFVWIGLISYSAYLWHQPLFAFARIRIAGEPAQSTMLALSILTFLLAWLSWRFVERPFRNPAGGQYGNSRNILIATIVTVSFFVTFGLTAILTNGLPARLPPELQQLAALADADKPARDACSLRDPQADFSRRTCVHGSDTARMEIGILGDSHAGALAPALGVVLGSENIALRQLTYNGCMPVVGLRRVGNRHPCKEFNDAYRNYLSGSETPDTLLFLAHWSLYINGIQFDNQEGGKARGPEGYFIPSQEADTFRYDPGRLNALKKIVRTSFEDYLALGKRIAIIYPVPEAGWDVPAKLGANLLNGVDPAQELTTSYEAVHKRNAPVREILDAVPDNPNLLRIYPEKVFCEAIPGGRCKLTIGGKPAYFDEHHLSRTGANLLAAHIVNVLKDNGWL